ncbi:hypothetical protein AAG747_26420 [Rapidithrix thailandica]|uniref:Uncharacterized protein n=1 Tax=Rapidithrix thailandica TaxID=413964 RepID=A0AAW9SI42_9BACT
MTMKISLLVVRVSSQLTSVALITIRQIDEKPGITNEWLRGWVLGRFVQAFNFRKYKA